MKTNNVMVRKMAQFNVEQRTKDGMFNATALLKQWNKAVENHEVLIPHLDRGLKKKDLDDYFAISPTKEYINTIIAKENLSSRNEVVKAVRGKYNGGTWMHPMLFFDFAMWLNSNFKYDVIKFVYDQMIKYRNDAGDAYKELGSSVGMVVSKSFMPAAMSNISKAINFVVFGEHYTAVRNDKGTEDMQRELFELEHKVSELINDGFLKTYDDIINYLRKKWKEKYTPKVLQ